MHPNIPTSEQAENTRQRRAQRTTAIGPHLSANGRQLVLEQVVDMGERPHADLTGRIC